MTNDAELAPKWGWPLFDLALLELAAVEREAARAALLELLDCRGQRVCARGRVVLRQGIEFHE